MKKTNVNAVRKLEKIIDDVQGKATARTISAKLVAQYAEKLETKLSKIGLTKKLMKGLLVIVDPNAQEFPRAYKYEPISTTFYLERGSSDWFVSSIDRTRCGNVEFLIVSKITSEQKKAIIDHQFKMAKIKVNYIRTKESIKEY